MELHTTLRSTPITDGLSVDVEEYFHVEAFTDQVDMHHWPLFPSRVRSSIDRVLDLFARYGCKATFFVLGWVAEREPKIVRDIAAGGHEVACHGFAHRRIHRLTPEKFCEDLRRARAAIEDAGGLRITGFRAPTFSITPQTVWALDILAEEGFLYDASIYPIRHDLYGFPGAPRFGHWRVVKAGARIYELPASTVRVGSVNLPAAGGGYLRLLPFTYTRWALRRIHEVDRQPAIVYFHPWEIDPEQPRINGAWKSRLRQYRGLKRMESRISRLLARGRFQPLATMVPTFPAIMARTADTAG